MLAALAKGPQTLFQTVSMTVEMNEGAAAAFAEAALRPSGLRCGRGARACDHPANRGNGALARRWALGGLVFKLSPPCRSLLLQAKFRTFVTASFERPRHRAANGTPFRARTGRPSDLG